MMKKEIKEQFKNAIFELFLSKDYKNSEEIKNKIQKLKKELALLMIAEKEGKQNDRHTKK